MMTDIGEITVGTLLERVKDTVSPHVTKGGIYKVIEIDKWGSVVNGDRLGKIYIVPRDYKIVGHVDNNIIKELDQMLEFCLKYNEIESYIVNKA